MFFLKPRRISFGAAFLFAFQCGVRIRRVVPCADAFHPVGEVNAEYTESGNRDFVETGNCPSLRGFRIKV